MSMYREFSSVIQMNVIIMRYDHRMNVNPKKEIYSSFRKHKMS